MELQNEQAMNHKPAEFHILEPHKRGKPYANKTFIFPIISDRAGRSY